MAEIEQEPQDGTDLLFGTGFDPLRVANSGD